MGGYFRGIGKDVEELREGRFYWGLGKNSWRLGWEEDILELLRRGEVI